MPQWTFQGSSIGHFTPNSNIVKQCKHKYCLLLINSQTPQFYFQTAIGQLLKTTRTIQLWCIDYFWIFGKKSYFFKLQWPIMIPGYRYCYSWCQTLVSYPNSLAFTLQSQFSRKSSQNNEVILEIPF